jgi:hypothetical protein
MAIEAPIAPLAVSSREGSIRCASWPTGGETMLAGGEGSRGVCVWRVYASESTSNQEAT